MKLVVITGSHHKEGTTAHLAESFIKGAVESGNKIFRFDAAFEAIHPCLACDECKKGDKICICSSLKDALCLWANTGIPSLAIQGEGYRMSDTAINELKKRFNRIYICLDNDEAGLKDAVQLASKTGFINVVLPQFKGGKDISDLYKVLGNKEQFKQTILSLFK